MGVPALLLGLWSLFRGLRSPRDERPPSASSVTSSAGLSGMLGGWSKVGQTSAARTGSGSRPSSGGDAIARIERLQKLRESGALTEAEFDKEKAKILAEQ
ncbi:MAG: SHOCT domain-containing protein [Actinobacteria bacterium]|nr:SHOCT domain-containing protein [Actinomycetota bacterium]